MAVGEEEGAAGPGHPSFESLPRPRPQRSWQREPTKLAPTQAPRDFPCLLGVNLRVDFRRDYRAVTQDDPGRLNAVGRPNPCRRIVPKLIRTPRWNTREVAGFLDGVAVGADCVEITSVSLRMPSFR